MKTVSLRVSVVNNVPVLRLQFFLILRNYKFNFKFKCNFLFITLGCLWNFTLIEIGHSFSAFFNFAPMIPVVEEIFFLYLCTNTLLPILTNTSPLGHWCIVQCLCLTSSIKKKMDNIKIKEFIFWKFTLMNLLMEIFCCKSLWIIDIDVWN
jgi:hypothetical protein